MAVAVTTCREDRYRDRLTKTERGYAGKKWRLITGTDDLAAAHGGAGLPAIGDAWSGGLPLVTCTAVDIEVNTHVTGGVGTCLAEISYQSPDFRRAEAPKVLNSKWTEFRPSVVNITAYQDAEAAAGAVGSGRDKPINNGFGAPARRGAIEVVVHKYLSGAAIDATLMTQLITLHAKQARNSGTLTLPPMSSGSVSYSVAIGELMFYSFNIPQTPTFYSGSTPVYELAISMGYAPDHLFRWQLVDKDGKALTGGGNTVANVLNESASFAGLW